MSTVSSATTAANLAAVHPRPASLTRIAAIDAGGVATGGFAADANFSGGRVYATGAAINVAAANAAPAAVYQSQRYGTASYTFSGLQPGGIYDVRLHFAELYYGVAGRPGVGQRVFNIIVNGTAAVTNLDVVAVAGGPNIAVVRDAIAVADANGRIVVALANGAVDNPILNGLELFSGAAPTTAINVGGGTVGTFVPDTGRSGGALYGTNATIDTSAANAAPAAVYQSQAYGALSVRIPALAANAPYVVRLHFAELYYGLQGRPGVGARQFNVAINGATVATNLDVVAAAGGPNVALVRDFPVNSDAAGGITIAFSNGAVDSPIINGVEILTPSAAVAGGAGTPIHTASSADAFVASAGVNTHLSFYGTIYGDNFPAIASLLAGLGVRHIRDGVTLGQSNLCSEFQQLAASGVKLDAIVTTAQSAADYAAFASCVGSALETWEGPNEYDLSGDPNWTTTLRATVSAIGAYGAKTGTPVISPALTSSGAYAAVTPLGSNLSNANMHDYFGGRNPGTPGWGGTDPFGCYGALPWQIGVAQQATGSLPVIATETGYGESSADYGWVATDVKMRYTLRTLLEHWNDGVPRTFLYELADEGGPPFGSYGLVDGAGNPKPAYRALKNLLHHLADPGSTFTPAALAYALTGPSNLHQALFQKRDGSYHLALWIEAQEWDPDAHTPITVAPQSVGVAFATTPNSIATYTFDASGNAVAGTIARSSAISLTIGTTPTIVDISM